MSHPSMQEAAPPEVVTDRSIWWVPEWTPDPANSGFFGKRVDSPSNIKWAGADVSWRQVVGELRAPLYVTTDTDIIRPGHTSTLAGRPRRGPGWRPALLAANVCRRSRVGTQWIGTNAVRSPSRWCVKIRPAMSCSGRPTMSLFGTLRGMQSWMHTHGCSDRKDRSPG